MPNIEADLKEDNSITRKVFEVKSALPHYRRAMKIHKNYLRLMKHSHTSVDDVTIHLWHLGLQWSVMSSKMDYYATSLIPSSHSEWTNKMNNFSRL